VIIRYDGIIRDSRILARSGDIMRIAVEHGEDAVELTLVDGIWYSESRTPVSFEFLGGVEIALVFSENGGNLQPRTYLLSGHAVSDTLRC
jgi:hypothetical protein